MGLIALTFLNLNLQFCVNFSLRYPKLEIGNFRVMKISVFANKNVYFLGVNFPGWLAIKSKMA